MSSFVKIASPRSSHARVLNGYVAAVLFTALAAAACLSLSSNFIAQAPYSAYFLAVIAVVWYARATGPAVVAIALGSIAAQFTTRSAIAEAPLTPSPVGRLVVFAILAVVVVLFTRALQRARQSAEHLAREYDEQRERLEVTLSSIGDAVMVSDVNEHVTYLNPVAEKLTGWRLAAAAGKPVEEVFRIVHEETRAPVNSPVTRSLQKGGAVKLGDPSILIARDGVQRSIDDTAAPIRDAHGRVAGAILVFRDVTEQRESERRIVEARAYAERIVDTVPEPILILDAARRVVRANRSFYRTFACTPEEVEGRHLQAVGSGEWALPRLHTLLERVIATEAGFDNLEVESVFGSLGSRIMLLYARRLVVEPGQPNLVLLMMEDISDRRATENKLRESEERYRLVVEGATGFALVMLDTTGRVVSWNVGAERLLGYTEAEIIGENFARFFLPADQAADLPQRELAVAARDEEGPDDNWLVRKDGSHFWASGATTALRDDAGHLRAFTKVVRDITDRRRAHDALREADRRKDEFLATLAHELRNPLAPMRTALHVMQRSGPSDGEWQRTWEIMDRQTRQMTRLIDDLLEVSRITQGRMVLQRQTIELNAVVQHAIETIRPLIERQRHTLNVSLVSPAPAVDGDPARLAQVFANLLDNAAKYQDPGGTIDLSVDVRREHAIVSVHDEGVGMTPDQRVNVFEMFAQVDSGVDRSHGGLGIGLSLVKRLVELHGGTVSAESSGLGQGSTFVVSLPIVRHVREDAETQSSQSTLPPVPQRRVLVVDDNEDAASTLASLLELNGHVAQVAHDGEQALRAAEAWRPDVVLLDIGLPRLNGYDVCRHLRSQAWARELRIVALTGWGQVDDRKRSEAAGFDRHLVKPVDPDLLIQMMKEPTHGQLS
jgi:PAS domain S-box-containing protein